MSVWLERSRAALAHHFAGDATGTIGTDGTKAPAAPPNVPIVPIGQSFELAERAAIIEGGAGVPRTWAEGFARLEATSIPRGVDAASWLAMLNAAGRFLDQWGAKAAALGWTAAQLFGLDPNAPLNRRDHRGAAFFLANAEVVAITADDIAIRANGAVQRIHRRDGLKVPAWESLP